jgi:hypothetical protein
MTPTGIRTDLVTRLTGATAAGSRVYDSRQLDLPGDELPAVVITSMGGSEDRRPTRGLVHKRTERVQITGVVSGTADATLAATVDTMEAAILDHLFGDDEWLGAFDSVASIRTDKNLDINASVSCGAIGITLELEYHVQYANLNTPDHLHAVAVTTDTTEPAGADVSERVISLVGP